MVFVAVLLLITSGWAALQQASEDRRRPPAGFILSLLAALLPAFLLWVVSIVLSFHLGWWGESIRVPQKAGWLLVVGVACYLPVSIMLLVVRARGASPRKGRE